MGRRCETCVRADRSKIDAALAVGSSVAGVARAYHSNERSLYRHIKNGHVPGILKKPPKPVMPTVTVEEIDRIRSQGSTPPKASPAPAPTVVESVSLRSPDDVLAALEWSVAETRSLLQRAKDAGNLELQNRLLQTAIAALDKLAKASGVYSDGAIVNINTGARRMEMAVAKLSDEQLEASLAALARGEQVAIEGEVVG